MMARFNEVFDNGFVPLETMLFQPYDSNDPDFNWTDSDTDDSVKQYSLGTNSDYLEGDYVSTVATTQENSVFNEAVSYKNTYTDYELSYSKPMEAATYNNISLRGQDNSSNIGGNQNSAIQNWASNSKVEDKEMHVAFHTNWVTLIEDMTLNADHSGTKTSKNTTKTDPSSLAIKATAKDARCNSTDHISTLSDDYHSFESESSVCNETITSDSNLQSSFKQIPLYKGYQLVGDSQLVRFSGQLLNMKEHVVYTENGKRRIGCCIGGQKIGDLKKCLLEHEEQLAPNIIMLIGTNDFINKTKRECMCRSYNSIVTMLKRVVKKIVLLTVPPVPRLAKRDPNHLADLKKFNDFISTFDDQKKVFVVDVASIFVSYSNTISEQYFEPWIMKKFATKEDMIHLNKAGLKMMMTALDVNYFDVFH